MHIRLLGRLEIETGGSVRPLPRSRKTRALLAYLADARAPHGRSRLCDLLWDGPADPRAALRWSIAKLRTLLDEPGHARVLTEGDTVALDTGDAVLDVAILEARIGAGPARANVEDLREAAGLFRGTFLEGLELDGCYRFDAWLAGRREHYRELRSTVLAELVARLDHAPAQALPVALARLSVEPYRESAYLDVARALDSLGRTDEARAHLERAELVLERALGVSPSAELRALARRLSARPAPVAPAPQRPGDDVAAARRALREGRPAEARTLLERALVQADSLPPGQRPERRIEALEPFVHPTMSSHRPDDLGARIREAIGEADRAGRPDLVRSAFYLVANLHYQGGDFDGAVRDTLRAVDTGRLADPVTVVRALADTGRCLGMLERHPARARRLIAEARALASVVDEPLHEIDMGDSLVLRHEGRYEAALECLARALAAIRACDDDWWEVTCLLWMPMLHLERGRPADALVSCGELRAVTWRREQDAEATFAAGLEEVARCRIDARRTTGRLEAALDGLRNLDSRWMLAYVQLDAAALDAGAGEARSAARRAEEALEAARSVGRQNEVAVARARLATLAVGAGNGAEASRHLRALEGDGVQLAWLSARARAALALARAELPS